MKTKNMAIEEQFQNLTEKSQKETKVMSQPHKYIAIHFPQSVHALQ